MTETYDAMRHFADSWGLLFMVTVFVFVILFVLLRPGASRIARDAASIPFNEDEPHGR